MNIEIEKGLVLKNPTMESKGIKDRFEIDHFTLENIGESLGLFLEVVFIGEGNQMKHSRSYEVKEGVTEKEFISNHKLLSIFE